MKLTLQIAAGIFLAGLISFAFWTTFIAAGAAAVVHSMPRIAPTVIYQVSTPAPAQRVQLSETTITAKPAEDCTNFVQLGDQAKHCLRDAATARR